ncbi:DMT family transporter, partial [Rhodobaculum claviforme]|uniref:DMT family transporter n=1 Tax=Rhodobaculum claviforme TaxID=1549854 RepID=UPI001912CBBF
MTGNLRGALFALAAFAVFASHDAVIKALGGTLSPVQILFFSTLFGFPLVGMMLMRDRTDGTLVPRHPWWVALRTLSAVVGALAAFHAFTTLPLAQVYAILFAAPLLITVLAIPILGERVRLRRGLAVLVGLAGVMIVLRPGSADLEVGHLAALAAAVFSALSAIIMRKIGAEERSVVLIIYPLMANFLLMGALLPLVYVPMQMAELGAAAVIAGLGFVGMLLVIGAYRAGEAVAIAPMQYSQILWATLWGLVFFDEVPDAATLLGAGVVIASGVYIVMREGRAGASRTRPVLAARSRAGTPTAPALP